MYDLSIVVSGIRTNRWKELYDSVFTASKRHTWEIVFISPFDLPEELKDKENITLVKDNGHVPRCIQKGVLYAKSDLFFITVDDGYLAEDSIDLALDYYKENCGYKDVIAMLYGEGGNMMPSEYWNAHHHADLRKPGIPAHFKIANQPIMNKNYFIELGGFDCVNFEYLDKPIHDLMFRLQYDGGVVHFSPIHSCIATWTPGTEGDHGPIHFAETTHDGPLFHAMYQDPDIISKRVRLIYDNWKQTPDVWVRRFTNGVPETYEDLCNREGYKF